MKFLTTFILSLFLFTNCFSQFIIDSDSLPKQELPTWFIYKGDTVGLVLSVEQVQKIDSDLELLSWLEKKGFSCDSTITAYIRVIDDLGKQITIFKVNVEELSAQIKDKDSQIDNLKGQVNAHIKDLNLANEQIEKWKQINLNNNARITRLKIQRNLWIGGGVLATATATLVTFFILK